MSSRDLAQLAPDVHELCNRWLKASRAAGMDPLITCTWRSQAEQDALYAQGRTKPGRIVTWTRRSRHTAVDLNGRPAALAWDFVPLIAGKAVWKANHPHWLALGQLAESMGLVWGKRFRDRRGRPIPDLPHIQRLLP